MLQDVRDSLAQFGCEVAEDQVGIRLAHRSDVLDVMAHDRVGDAEVGGRTVRQMTHDEGCRLATVLVYDYDVREVVGTTCFDQLGVRLRK